MDLDLGSLDSVRRFVADFAARGLPPIGAIVCNAGIQIVSGITYNDDGYETTFAVNHLAGCGKTGLAELFCSSG
jgi:NAD(P)-dependent dehydrogenase (short-subunit alcohol dehydrogenase family)